MARTMTRPSVEAAFAAAVAGDVTQAIAIYRELLVGAPRDPIFHNSLGQLLLQAGDFAAGWEEYEWREQRAMPMPRWRGAPLNGAGILLHGEQGFGDNFHFVRYAKLVAAKGGNVVVATRQGLRPLLATVPGVSQAIESGENIPAVRFHAPLMSLPYIFATRLNTIPGEVPYISADPALAAAWKERLAPYSGLRVGLVWSGNTDAVYNKRRSPGLQAFESLFEVPGVAFFGLQMGGGRADLEGFARPANFVDLGGYLTSFSETAAAMMNLDLIISPCTSPAHLAGALARPLWVPLATDADWRWLMHRDTSPWYPTARLFRQVTPGDWEPPVAKMKAELERLAAER